MVKAVFFDWDGTLWDALGFIVETYTEVFEQVGLRPWTRQEYRENFTHDWRKSLKLMGLDAHEGLVVDHWEKRISEKHPHAYPWAVELIGKMKKDHLVGVVSSAPGNALRRELERSELWEMMDVVVSKDDVKRIKPDPQPLMLASCVVEASPEESVYVGDMADDIIAAKAAGMRSVAVTWGIHSKKRLIAEKPWFLAEKPAELWDYIKGLP